MDDTVVIKPLVSVTLDTTGISFPRVQSDNQSEHLRRSITAFDEYSPSVLRIAHQPITAKRNRQRSLIAFDQDFGRVDSSDILIRTDKLTVALQISKDPGVLSSEALASFNFLVGALTETRGGVPFALLKSILNGET